MGGATEEERRRKKQRLGIYNKLDYVTLGIFALLLIISLVVLNTASTNVIEDDPNYYVRRQSLLMLVGLFLFFAVVFYYYRRYRDWWKVAYVGIVILLIIVFLFGSGDGVKSWIFGFQPSELAKLVMIISFAAWLANNRERLKEVKFTLLSMAYMSLPMLLVLIEPDLGTALVFIFIMLVMLFVAGANRKVLYGTIGALVLFAAIIYTSLYFYTDGFTKVLEENIPFIPLKYYQLMRLVIFINPQMDPYGSGYHIIQSKIAIGSGGLFGKGYGDGTQVQGNFLPAHHTDFIFSVLGEEMGFFFTVFVMILYMVFLIRLMRAAFIARDFFGTLIATGICAMIIFQVLVNVGMAMGIMPITGIPLPFFSYGVTSLWVNMLSVGVIFSIILRGRKIT
ncbi:MAG: rod shape-determining protein RodA [Bacillota bacterium]|nr:rod shape-determining protein RodA [Bacillota bacterium]